MIGSWLWCTLMALCFLQNAYCLPFPSTTSSVIVVAGEEVSSTTVKEPLTDSSSEASVSEQPTQEWPSNETKENSHYKPKITSMHVESNVTLRYAKTSVTSKVANPDIKANEVTFSVVIPETAFITAFSMEIDGKVYDAYVKEKDEAKKEYQTAISSGIAAAHVAVKARDSNHFTVSVNVEPQKKAIFRLYYEELLSRRLGLYNLVMNLSPGQLVDDFKVDVDITETSPITAVYVPSLRTGNEIDADPSDAPNEYAQKTISEDKFNAKISFSPNRAQQQELMKMFKEREKPTPQPVTYYGMYDRPQKPTTEEDGLKGQFVVQYDVDRKPKSEVMINDGYFVHFFASSELKPLNKHVIFVLDVSGSMAGRKINQLKDAMTSILEDLNPGDYFSIMDFHYSVKVYNLENPSKNAIFRSNSDNYMYPWEDDDDKPQADPLLPPPYKASPENIQKAIPIIKHLDARGGTNIYDALTTALKVANIGIQMTTMLSEGSNEVRLPEPMIIFLTDGDPTVGETNTDEILKAVNELNPKNVSLFSLAFGEDADRSFLRRVALQNSGFLRHIYEAADAAMQLRHFYRLVASPMLANVTFLYPKDQIEESTITKKKFDYYFIGSELVVAGKLTDKTNTDIPLSLHANAYTGPIDFIPTVLPEKKRSNFWPLERMWAYISIKQLLDERDEKGGKAEDLNDPNSPAKKALDLALKYSFVTPLTSLVVVKPNSTSAVDAESVDASGVDNSGYALPLIASGHSASAASAGFGFAPQFLAPHSQGYSGPSAPHFVPTTTYRAPTPSRVFDTAPVSGDESDSDAQQESYIAPSDKLETSTTEKEKDSKKTSTNDEEKTETKNKDQTSSTEKPLEPSTPDKVEQPKTNATIVPDPKERLNLYGLEAHSWLAQYLDPKEDAFSIILPSKSVLKYKLKQKTQNDGEGGEQKPCANSIGGGLGVCEYLTSCKQLNDGFKDLDTYLNYFCDANGFAGICCKTEAP